MNGKDKIKYWNACEENDLVNEINNLVSIEQILKNHDRKIRGITMRIEKLINDPEQSKKINNISLVVTTYLNIPKPKNQIDYDKLYEEILRYNTLEEISNNYNNIPIFKIKNILGIFLDRKDNDISKKLRIKCLLGTSDQLEFAENIYKKKVNKCAEPTNNLDINSVIISLLGEIKTMKTDIFDIKNRVKVIMDKVDKIEKNTGSNLNNYETSKDGKIIKGVRNIKKNNLEISNGGQQSDFLPNENNKINDGNKIDDGNKINDDNKINEQFEKNLIELEENYKDNKKDAIVIPYDEKIRTKNDKHTINKQVEKIINSSKSYKKINTSKIDNLTFADEIADGDEADEDELEKELEKYLK